MSYRMKSLLVLLLGIVACPWGAGGQVVRGTVLDRESRLPVTGAAVLVRDSSREVAGFARTDEAGRFTLRVPAADYSVRVVRVGFTPESVSTAGLASLDTAHVVIEMRPLATRLTPVVIETEKRGIREATMMRLNLKTLATRIITPSEIALASRGARTYLDAIRSGLPAGVTVSERNLCVATTRGSAIDARSSCAMVYVDGVRLDDPSAALERVQPLWLDHAIFVHAADAGIRFGTGTAGGVLLLFTKYGGYALDDMLAASALRRPQ